MSQPRLPHNLKLNLLTVAGILLLGLTVGLLLGSHPTPAAAQAGPPAPPAAPASAGATPADIRAITQPSPVVSAVAYQSRTDYEQDPFENSRLRRTTTTVVRYAIVHADGTMEIKDAP